MVRDRVSKNDFAEFSMKGNFLYGNHYDRFRHRIRKILAMNQKSTIWVALLAIALGSAARAAAVIGTISFSSGAGGGVILQNAGGMATTDIAQAVAIQSWLFPQVDLRDGSFISVTNGDPVSMPSTWIFNPSTPLSPLWTIPGTDNFAFHLASATIEFQQAGFLLIKGIGTLSGTGFDATPAEWEFTTQGVAANGRFSWSSTTTAIPEFGATALFSTTLLGACLLRRRNPALPSPHNHNHENDISPRDVPDCLDRPDIGDPSGVHFRLD